MGGVSNEEQSSLIALLLAVELATLLSQHVLTSRWGWGSCCRFGKYEKSWRTHCMNSCKLPSGYPRYGNVG